MSEDSKSDKKIYILVERASNLSRGVSRALWPATARRLVETSRAAQRRRARLMRRRSSLLPTLPAALPQWLPRLFLAALVASSMLSGGTLVLAVLWHLWFLPLCAALALAVSLLALRSRWPANFPSVPLSQQTVMDSSLPASSSAGMPWKSLPGQLGAPETPMPDPPSLVRVLETFDLSRGELEPALTEVPWPPSSAAGTRSDWSERASSCGTASVAPLPDELPCSSAGAPAAPGSSPLAAPSTPLGFAPPRAVGNSQPGLPGRGLPDQPQSPRSACGQPAEIPVTRPFAGTEVNGEGEAGGAPSAAVESKNEEDEGEKL
ncbi:MAG: hypothetical protein IRZ31_09785 [Thermogemmatispora sp.]|uniref:hypothetical protein n=1 Tax=Thermogemmatispora sp. TaxID=1968838 RepID=UPI00262D6A16|nr:hypothetical protein [Thermogemmatispora sp.]MBX5457181.1 hypothetical protein [Thermogemmatispora sp.]